MPASSTTLSQELVNEYNDRFPCDLCVIPEENDSENCDLSEMRVHSKVKVSPSILNKRKLRALRAREHAKVFANERMKKELEKTPFARIHIPTCDDCFELVCDCETCPECDGYGPTFPSLENRCKDCHPNFSDYDSEGLDDETIIKLSKGPFSDSEEDCNDSDDSDCYDSEYETSPDTPSEIEAYDL